MLDEPRLERAIGVVYRPRTERASHDLHAVAADEFDVLIHVDAGTTVRPLALSGVGERTVPLRATAV